MHLLTSTVSSTADMSSWQKLVRRVKLQQSCGIARIHAMQQMTLDVKQPRLEERADAQAHRTTSAVRDGSRMDNNADDDRSVENDPANAGDVDRLVVFLKPIDEP